MSVRAPPDSDSAPPVALVAFGVKVIPPLVQVVALVSVPMDELVNVHALPLLNEPSQLAGLVSDPFAGAVNHVAGARDACWEHVKIAMATAARMKSDGDFFMVVGVMGWRLSETR